VYEGFDLRSIKPKKNDARAEKPFLMRTMSF
jgi:hypothetical protein